MNRCPETLLSLFVVVVVVKDVNREASDRNKPPDQSWWSEDPMLGRSSKRSGFVETLSGGIGFGEIVELNYSRGPDQGKIHEFFFVVVSVAAVVVQVQVDRECLLS